MEKELFEKQLGAIASVSVGLKEGGLVAEIRVPVAALLDVAAAKVKAAIPGQVDDVIIDLVINTAKKELLK